MDSAGTTMPRITNISQMWALLNVFTYDSDGKERPVNHLNEWGGFSRVLKMPVFTAWRDATSYDKDAKMTSAVISDAEWGAKVGTNNQERWVDYAIEHQGRAAFFVIHAADEEANPRKIAAIDADRVVIGTIKREGTKAILTGQPRSL